MKPILLILALLAAVPVSAQQITLPPVVLMPFQCAGGCTIAGVVKFPDGTAAAPSITFANDPNTGIYSPGADGVGVSANGLVQHITAVDKFRLQSAAEFGWAASSSAWASSFDLILARDAANTLAQRNGTTEQQFNLYNTFTNASNYERLEVDWSGNQLYINTRSAGTGSSREMLLGTVGASLLTFFTSNTARWTIGASTGHLLAASAVGVGNAVPFSINTAPSGPVACTSPTVTWSNGTAAFQIDVGGTCAGISTLVVTLPAVTNAWSCSAINVGASATAAIEMTASTTTTATFTNYTRTTGAVLVWVDGADVRISCLGG